MKLHAYQLCQWCDTALHGHRKWLWLGANLLALLLAALLRLLVPVLCALLLANAVAGLYLLHRHHAFGAVYQRTPHPRDAQCETILIDAALIGEGTRLRAAAQPIDTAGALSLRLGSGALLLGTAMTLTADELPPADRAAVLSAVQQLNIKPGRMRSHSPLLRREEADSVTTVTVRDGTQERRYLLGPADALAKVCASIWEGHPRLMNEQDLARIADTARYIAQGNCRVTAWATALDGEAPIFLGMAGIGESVHLNAMQDVAALRNQGLTVMLEPGEQPDTDLEALRALLELPDHHARADLHLTTRPVADGTTLGITRVPGESLLEPVSLLRQRFGTIETTLRRFAAMLGIPLIMCLLFSCWPAAVFSAALMLYTAIALGVDVNLPLPRWQTLLGAGLSALLARLFLATQPVSLAMMGSGILAACTAAGCAVRLCGAGFRMKGPGCRASIVLPASAVLYGLIAVLLALGEGAALLLPLVFSLLMAAVILLLLLKHMIFR